MSVNPIQGLMGNIHPTDYSFIRKYCSSLYTLTRKTFGQITRWIPNGAAHSSSEILKRHLRNRWVDVKVDFKLYIV